MSETDPRLERLYDYTKFHIGIYLLAAGTMVTIAGSEELQGFLTDLAENRRLLIAAIGAMGVAGAAGGIIASSCATAANLKEVWEKPIGPWQTKLMAGQWWARVEHTSFWLSSVLFTAAALLPA